MALVCENGVQLEMETPFEKVASASDQFYIKSLYGGAKHKTLFCVFVIVLKP